MHGPTQYYRGKGSGERNWPENLGVLFNPIAMPSPFDPAGQQTDPDAKLVAALDRVGQALRVLLWDAAKASPGTRSLSPAQIQILIFLRYHPEALARVGQLAREFDLTAATVSDAVRTLTEKGLVEKAPDPTDGRAIVLRLTPHGKRVVQQLADWTAPIQAHLAHLPAEDKAQTLDVLFALIARLQDTGVITVARMCQTCQHFARQAHPNAGAPHHCQLLDMPLAIRDLRLDCPEHEPTTETA